MTRSVAVPELSNLGRAATRPASGATIEVTSPCDGRPIGRIPDSDAAAVAAVVDGASAAAQGWAQTPIKVRSGHLFCYRDLLLAHMDELAQCAARESGKTVAEARAGVEKGVEVVEYALGLQNQERGGSVEVSRGVFCESRRVPLGVVAGITPFNFPAMVPLWMFPIAVTLGNAFVLKPSEKVPMTAQRLAELMRDAGYPEGVLSVVHGGKQAVEALIAHPDVAAYGFVGSTAVARQVYASAAQLGKRVLALGGAKNPMILMPDADPSIAVPGVVASFTGCAGQRCMAGSVLLAVGDCHALVDAIVAAAAQVQLGRDMGAIIDAAALARLEAAIARGLAEGAELRLDGRGPTPPPGSEGGHWLAPTVLDNVAPDGFCATEELFGPVLSIVRVPDLSAALAFERAGRYGNALSVFTESGAVARTVSLASQSGMVGVNVGVPVPREPFSFGGTRASRFGTGDITGDGGVALWSNLQKVTSKWKSAGDGTWMS